VHSALKEIICGSKILGRCAPRVSVLLDSRIGVPPVLFTEDQAPNHNFRKDLRAAAVESVDFKPC